MEGPKRQVMLSPRYQRVGVNSVLACVQGVAALLIFYQIKYDSFDIWGTHKTGHGFPFAYCSGNPPAPAC